MLYYNGLLLILVHFRKEKKRPSYKRAFNIYGYIVMIVYDGLLLTLPLLTINSNVKVVIPVTWGATKVAFG
jgi:hypothetical protein